MPTEKRLKIRTEAEIADLFGPPVLNLNDQRFFFALNEIERSRCVITYSGHLIAVRRTTSFDVLSAILMAISSAAARTRKSSCGMSVLG